MSAPSDERRHSLAPIGAALALIVIFVVVLSIPLGVASNLGLTQAQLTGWLVALYGVPGVLSVVLAWRYRQPLLLTSNIFVLIFVASLGSELSWAELVGASMLAGAAVSVLGLLGITDRLAGWLPASIVFGVPAGAVLPFVVDLFDALGGEPGVVGATLVAYLLGRRFLEPRVPAVLPAVVVGLVGAWLVGGLAAPPARIVFPLAELTMPVFSLPAVLTATPVMVVLITLQANAPSVVFLRTQGYDPPDRTIGLISGGGTLLASIFGPLGISLSLPATALTAGPDAGPQAIRHRAALLAGAAAVVFALLAGYAAELETLILRPLLVAVIGLAVVGVFAGALKQVVSGPLVIGPLFSFGIALSDLSLFGLGPFFWALVVGLGVSRLVEHAAWAELQARDPSEA